MRPIVGAGWVAVLKHYPFPQNSVRNRTALLPDRSRRRFGSFTGPKQVQDLRAESQDFGLLAGRRVDEGRALQGVAQKLELVAVEGQAHRRALQIDPHASSPFRVSSFSELTSPSCCSPQGSTSTSGGAQDDEYPPRSTKTPRSRVLRGIAGEQRAGSYAPRPAWRGSGR